MTKIPCDECTPLLEMVMVGIKTVVLGSELQKKGNEDIEYSKFEEKGVEFSKFEEKVNNGVFICFEIESAESEMEDASASRVQPAARKENASH